MELLNGSFAKGKITKETSNPFTLTVDGIYLIEILSKAKSEKQTGSDDEDLKIEIDGQKFPKLTDSTEYFNSPAGFSGAALKGLVKAVCFIATLEKGSHTLSYFPDESTEIIDAQIYRLVNDTKLETLDLHPKYHADDGDRRPWVTYVFFNTGVVNFSLIADLERRFIDSDDIKIIVDGNIKRNYRNDKLHKLWYFAASKFIGTRQTETFAINLGPGLHYVELHADRTPLLNQVTFSQLKGVTIHDKIRAAANRFGLDPELMVRLAQWESTFVATKVSETGAKGLFQLQNSALEESKKHGYEVKDVFDIDQNIEGAMTYFKYLYDLYEGTPDRLHKTIAAWNWGMGRFSREGSFNLNAAPLKVRTFIHNVEGK